MLHIDLLQEYYTSAITGILNVVLTTHSYTDEATTNGQ